MKIAGTEDGDDHAVGEDVNDRDGADMHVSVDDGNDNNER